MGETGSYLYAVAAPFDDGVIGGLRGVAGEPVRAVRHRDLVAVVGTVDTGATGSFGEEALARNLDDVGWLEAAARAHHAVVDGVARTVPAAPLRLATIYSDDDGVRDRLERWHDGLRRALDELAGRAEWSVKVYAPQPPSSSGPTAADDVHAELARHAVDTRRLAVRDQSPTGDDAPMSLNAAYLVASERADAFVIAVEELWERYADCRIELAGPWPAYSFVTVDES